MSIWNPWGEARRLRRQLDRAEAVILRHNIERDGEIDTLKRQCRDLEVRLRSATTERDSAILRMKDMHRRDPVTGRLLPKGK